MLTDCIYFQYAKERECDKSTGSCSQNKPYNTTKGSLYKYTYTYMCVLYRQTDGDLECDSSGSMEASQ